jgi:hypothetical protein
MRNCVIYAVHLGAISTAYISEAMNEGGECVGLTQYRDQNWFWVLRLRVLNPFLLQPHC